MFTLLANLARMNKREFLKTASALSVGVVLSPVISCANNKAVASVLGLPTEEGFTLPALGFDFKALEPHIDGMTMEIHHGKHHAAYVANLNKAIATLPAYAGKSIEQVCEMVTSTDGAIRNNGGGHYNHSKFWKWITPGGAKAPSGDLLIAIERNFGNLDEFKKAFGEAAKTRFGSGWAWLSINAKQQLEISSTPNQDNPLMKSLVDKPGTPILGLDVWEHAYYLNYQNKRPDYITAFWNVVNWDVVSADYAAAMKK